jgi:predicted esterase
VRARAVLAAGVALSTAVLGLAVATATTASSPATSPAAPTGLPSGAPPAAHMAEPTIPAPNGWPFPEAFPRTSGTGRYAAGAAYWTDFVYDDHGALGVEHAAPVAGLAPPIGTYTYPDGPAAGNGADIFRAAVGLTTDSSYWRVDWTTLVKPTVPIVEWALDTDHSPKTGSSTWGAGAKLTSPGIDEELVVSSKGAQLLRATDGRLLASFPVSVDMATRSFIVRAPRTVLPVSGAWTVRVAAGLANATGRAFAPVSASNGALPNEPPVYNVGFRTYKQEPASCGSCGAPNLKPIGHGAQTVNANMWNEAAQATALAKNNVTAFGQTVSWSDLAARRHTPELQPTGPSTRWYVTTLHLGQGVVRDATNSPRDAQGDLRPNFLPRVQPYTVFVPTSYKPGTPMPLTWVLHSLGVNHNQYAALDPHTLQRLCEQRHSICATTLGFGADGWYFDEAEVDFWQVWHQLAQHYTLDPTRTIISGYSMGGYASYKLGLTYPDLFAKAMPLAGPPICGARVIGPLEGTAGVGHCGKDGDTTPLVANARWLPYDIADGMADELVPFSSVLEQVQAFTKAGLRYRFTAYPASDHLAWAEEDDWTAEIDALGHPTVMQNPGSIHYAWYPAGSNPALGLGPTGVYWLRNLHPRAAKAGGLAVVNATSGARPIKPYVVLQRHQAVVPGDPRPGVATIETWNTLGGTTPTPHQRLTLSLRDVASVAVDMTRAGFGTGPVAVTVTTDGPTTVWFGTTAVHLRSGTSHFTV